MSPLSASERNRVQQYLRSAGDRVLGAIRKLGMPQMNFRPRHDRWSIAENLEHLTIVDRLVMSQILDVVAMQRTSNESQWAGKDDLLLERVRSRNPPMTAPEIICPARDANPERVAEDFELGRMRLMEFAGETNTPLRSYFFPHPVFGELDCYQWLLSSGGHYERHYEQIVEIKQDPGFLLAV